MAIEEDLKVRREKFIKSTESFLQDIDGLKDYGSRFMAKEMNEKVKVLNERLK